MAKTYFLCILPSAERTAIVEETEAPIDALVLGEVEAESWIEAKRALGFELTKGQAQSLIQ